MTTQSRWAVSPKEACAQIGCGITFLYQEIAAGRLEAKKIGRKTMVPSEGIARYIEKLPRAVLHTGRRGAA